MNLSFVDLIKNKLFKELKKTHPDDSAKTKWKELRSTISSRPGLTFETFVRHWWISHYSYVSAENIYKNFKDRWNKGEIVAATFMDKLLNDAEVYRKISAPQEEDFPQQSEKEIYRSLTSFKTFGVSQHRPLLIALFNAYSKKLIKLNNLESTLLFLEKFHFLFNGVCSMRASGIDGTYSKAARDISSTTTKQGVNTIINDLKVRLKDKAPEEEAFVKSFITLKYINGYTKDKSLIQYIFRGIEHHKRPNKEFKVHNITLEHIQAQSSGNEDFIGLIGNLIPLGSPLNGKAGDKPLKDKIPLYEKSDYSMAIQFVSDFNTKYDNAWNELNIKIRSEELARYCFNSVWNL